MRAVSRPMAAGRQPRSRLTVRSATDGCVRSPCWPEYNSAIRPRPDRHLLRERTGAEIGLGTAASRRWTSIWIVTHRTASVFSRIFESKQRKEISGIVGISDVAHHTVEESVEKSLLLLALVSLSLGLINLLADSSSRRRPHLLEPDGETQGQAGLAAGHGTGHDRRHRPRRAAGVRRAQQRHRPPWRRRLQRR